VPELPDPEPGLVIRYAYLWRDEADRGQEEGVKDRPCAVVLATRRRGEEGLTVVVAPITHSPPRGHGEALEIPSAVKARLGLDDERSWIVTDELNSFLWPGPDLRLVEEGDSGYAFGYLPERLAEELIRRVGNNVRARHARVVNRTE
jgi:mRNA-degrading endonuclease toxin of MazEF toxin-antitoxin module